MKDTRLLETVAGWPDWKLRALCLDESDLQIVELVRQYRASRGGQKASDWPGEDSV